MILLTSTSSMYAALMIVFTSRSSMLRSLLSMAALLLSKWRSQSHPRCLRSTRSCDLAHSYTKLILIWQSPTKSRIEIELMMWQYAIVILFNPKWQILTCTKVVSCGELAVQQRLYHVTLTCGPSISSKLVRLDGRLSCLTATKKIEWRIGIDLQWRGLVWPKWSCRPFTSSHLEWQDGKLAWLAKTKNIYWRTCLSCVMLVSTGDLDIYWRTFLSCVMLVRFRDLCVFT